MTDLPWFRLYHRIIDDEKVRLLAFEDRWHFIALCCLKAAGLLDEPQDALRERKIAVKLGIQTRELEEVCRRLFEVGLIDENMHPRAWEQLQFKADSSTDRVRKFREKSKVKRTKRFTPVSVTPPDTDTETDNTSLRSVSSAETLDAEFEIFWAAYPKRTGSNSRQDARKAFGKARKSASLEEIMDGVRHYAEYVTASGMDRQFVPHTTSWLNKALWEDRPTIITPKNPGARDVPSTTEHLLAAAQRLRAEAAYCDDPGEGSGHARMLPGSG